MIKETFDAVNSIVRVELSGDITMEDILQWKGDIIKNPYSVKVLRILFDVSKANYVFKLDDLKPIELLFIEGLQHFDAICFAALHNKPKETAYSNMLRHSLTIDNFHHNVFALESNAVKWLKSIK